MEAIIILLYFLPSLIAFARGHRNSAAICATNTLLGFTGLGWAAALIWAMTDNTRSAS